MRIFTLFLALLILAFSFYIISVNFPFKEIVATISVGLFIITAFKGVTD